MDGKPLTDEVWREYDFGGRVYLIENPAELFVGNTTHRVVDTDGIVHCVPAPGHNGCVLRWKPRDPSKPVQF
jgi:hypothetical protein